MGPPAVVRALPAEALVVAPAIRATAAAERAFQNDSISFPDVVNRRGIFAELFNAAENLVAENDRIVDFEFAMQVFYIGAADAAHLQAHP